MPLYEALRANLSVSDGPAEPAMANTLVAGYKDSVLFTLNAKR